MSNAVELQFIYAPQAHIIDRQTEKQQPTSKLVNRYLSTATQYLNRTKSFHLTPTTTNQHTIHRYSKNPSATNLDQLIPINVRPMNRSTLDKLSSNDQTMSMDETDSSRLPLNENNNSINVNKSQGFVNTLRRSLRKNKERFYNKQSSAMKSCHSLNTYEQHTSQDLQNIYKKISMTPTLLSHREKLANDNHMKSMKEDTNEDQMRKMETRVEIFFRAPHYAIDQTCFFFKFYPKTNRNANH